MKRVIETLNEMSFDLPDNWQVSEDIYSLPNGQGMVNKENYVSDKGEVISLFEVHRNPDEFFSYYDNLLNNYPKLTQAYEVVLRSNLKVGDFVLPSYIIKGFSGATIYTMQIFVNCGDCLACFMFALKSFNGSLKETIIENHILQEVIKILRTVE